MRTTLLILALLSIHILCFSQAQQKVSTITVKVKNPREGKYIGTINSSVAETSMVLRFLIKGIQVNTKQ